MNAPLTAAHRLATYGTLGPGRPNHHHVADIEGRWFHGQVHGRLVQHGWGADLGYPAIVLEPDGPTVDVDILESVELPGAWRRLDEFEGDGYRRVVVRVTTADGVIEASIYVHAD